MSFRQFLGAFLFEKPLSQIERERHDLIAKREVAVRYHRPVADIDAELKLLTTLSLRKKQRRVRVFA